MRKKKTSIYLAIILALIMGAFPLTALASTANLIGQANGTEVTHPSVGINKWVGTFYVTLDGNPTQYEVYCINFYVPVCTGPGFNQASDISQPEVVWILNNYYPNTNEPAILTTAAEKAAAVQLAIWYFTDGIDITTPYAGESPSNVLNAARDIIAIAGGKAATVPATPTTISMTPPQDIGGGQRQVTATVKDQNGNTMAGVDVQFTITGANSATGTVTTDTNGVATFTYNAPNSGADTATAVVNYTIPVGLRWERIGCQGLIMGESTTGQITESIGTPTAITLSSLSASSGRIAWPLGIMALVVMGVVLTGGLLRGTSWKR